MSDELQGLLRGWELSLRARNLWRPQLRNTLNPVASSWRLVEHDITTARRDRDGYGHQHKRLREAWAPRVGVVGGSGSTTAAQMASTVLPGLTSDEACEADEAEELVGVSSPPRLGLQR